MILDPKKYNAVNISNVSLSYMMGQSHLSLESGVSILLPVVESSRPKEAAPFCQHMAFKIVLGDIVQPQMIKSVEGHAGEAWGPVWK